MADPLDDAALDLLFRTARSYYTYLDRAVSPEQRVAIWDLMKMGPTSANQLPSRLIWCASADAKERLAGYASGNNPDKIRLAPVTVIIGMDMQFYDFLPEFFPIADAKAWFVGNQKAIDTSALRNSSLQGAYFIMAARALGLDTGPMSGFDNAAVDADFFAGTSIKSNFIAMVGYGDPSALYPRLPRPSFDRFNSIV